MQLYMTPLIDYYPPLKFDLPRDFFLPMYCNPHTPPQIRLMPILGGLNAW